MGQDNNIEASNWTGIANFTQDNIIWRFGILKRLRSDNGTPFFNMYVQRLLHDYGVDHVRLSLYNPQGNG